MENTKKMLESIEGLVYSLSALGKNVKVNHILDDNGLEGAERDIVHIFIEHTSNNMRPYYKARKRRREIERRSVKYALAASTVIGGLLGAGLGYLTRRSGQGIDHALYGTVAGAAIGLVAEAASHNLSKIVGYLAEGKYMGAINKKQIDIKDKTLNQLEAVK